MTHIFLYPAWFFTYSIILEIAFALITLMIAIYAFRIFKLTDNEQTKNFGIAFVFICGAYIIQAITNILIFSKFDDDVSVMVNLNNVFLINLFGLYAHALFYAIGLILLLYVTLKTDNWRIFILLLAMVCITIFFSTHKLFMFYVLCSLILFFIVIYYFLHYINHKKANNLVVLIGLLLLFIGTLYFVFATNAEIYYLIGYLFAMAAYLLLLINLIIILKHGKKKR
ncbi:TPA: hypothetical protein HA235_03255 [Candidatus Woesearchaeota archaeon]|nr:hypothetical protein [Candidatus Woesearchaeota archaeon]HIH31701.1 hypothetical protein [Candidatus Woesearchaeota archaeon]HIH54964.1 hypothetical protein [Candidatus Woesearchaeota archaeon]HIJ02657.1 hypothetical protein [Candidatus Woesearchaeota archaeon]HIJ13605.1 hypothetical protein [Candidatus Woesearchaeota archaeon]